MLNGTTTSLEDLIITAFAETPHLTAAELQQAVVKHGRTYTVQAVYQELRKLQKERIVTKVRDRYMLRVAWVLEMVKLSDKMYESYVRRGVLTELLPQPGQKVSWHIPTVNRVVTFWAQINLALLTTTEEKQLFEYLPHIWFHLAGAPDEEQFLRALRLSGTKYYCVIGQDTFLDRSYTSYAKQIRAEICFGQCPFRPSVETYHGVIGDFLISLRFNRKLSADIERVYSSVLKQKDISVGALSDLFNQNEQVTFTVERATAKALKYKKAFREFFGVT